MAKKRGAPKKPAAKRKSASKLLRLSDSEMETFTAAAELAGLPSSGWIRERLRTIARAELEAAGRNVPFFLHLADGQAGFKKNQQKSP